jgi:hypothetical protein
MNWLKNLFKCGQCEWLKEQYEFQKGKIERLELALYPLSTVAGARYGQMTQPGKPVDAKSAFARLNTDRPKTFAQQRDEYYARQEREMQEEAKLAAEAAKEPS